ncbi:methionine--tRNA ligase mes1 [Balamuthia mandrillaris]
MEDKPSREALEAEIAALKEAQKEVQDKMLALKKAKVTGSELDDVLAQLKDGKAKIAEQEKVLKALYPEAVESKKGKSKKEKTGNAPAASAKNKKKEVPKKKVELYQMPEGGLPDVGDQTGKEPVLPQKGKRNVLITSALPYVNNVPHLGNIIGCVLSADVFARYCRLRGYNTIYICGTDEYGTATEIKAMQEGLSEMEICNKYHAMHKQAYEWFGCQFDKFGRTTTESQTRIAQDIFTKIHARNYLVEKTLDQLWCAHCQRYLSDRYVEGTCPRPDCRYEDARGDQCDKCGRCYDAMELVNPRCKFCSNTPEIKREEHLFLDLPKLEDPLSKWVDKSSKEGIWSPNAINITTKTWLAGGLQPRCITRDLKWGTPVPLEKYKNKVFYVWFDAPIGYLSITAEYTEQWELWWKNPEEYDVKLYQFMGKDNVPFHTVIFPASLMATGDNWTLLDSVSTTEYLNYEGEQFSKSRGVGIFGDHVQKTGIPPSVWRYYLLSNRPESSDSSFSWSDLVAKNNNELLANLGNFVNRCLKFTADRLDKTVSASFDPERDLLPTEDKEQFLDKVNEHLRQYVEALEATKLKDGLFQAMQISKLGNQYLQDQKPWVLLSENRKRCEVVCAVAVNVVYLLARLLEPYIPHFSEMVLHQLALPHGLIPDRFAFEVPAGHVIRTPLPIFKELTEEEVAEIRSKIDVNPVFLERLKQKQAQGSSSAAAGSSKTAK